MNRVLMKYSENFYKRIIYNIYHKQGIELDLAS